MLEQFQFGGRPPAALYSKLQKASQESIAHARAICVDALALMGAMLKEVQKNAGAKGIGTSAVTVGNRTKASENSASNEDRAPPPTLADQGITKRQSMNAQALAAAKEKAPDVYEQVRAGKAPVAAARVEEGVRAQHPPGVGRGRVHHFLPFGFFGVGLSAGGGSEASPSTRGALNAVQSTPSAAAKARTVAQLGSR